MNKDAQAAHEAQPEQLNRGSGHRKTPRKPSKRVRTTNSSTIRQSRFKGLSGRTLAALDLGSES